MDKDINKYDINNVTDLTNPNFWYSNSQIPLTWIRGWNWRWERDHEPEDPKKWDFYFDTSKDALRCFVGQTRDWHYIEQYSWTKVYQANDYVTYLWKVYKCLDNDTFATDPTDPTARVQDILLTRRVPVKSWSYANFTTSDIPVPIPSWNYETLEFYPIWPLDTNDWGTTADYTNWITLTQTWLYLIIWTLYFDSWIKDRWINITWIDEWYTLQGDYVYRIDQDWTQNIVTTNGDDSVDVPVYVDRKEYVAKERFLQYSTIAFLSKGDVLWIQAYQNSWSPLGVVWKLQTFRLTY